MSGPRLHVEAKRLAVVAALAWMSLWNATYFLTVNPEAQRDVSWPPTRVVLEADPAEHAIGEK